MFCKLHELQIGTGLNLLYDYEECSDECPSCVNGVCEISDEYNTHLSTQRFGWRISIRIKFTEPVTADQGGIFTNMICLIHPTHTDVWVCKGLKQDKETIIYFVYHDGKQREIFRSLDTLNEIVNGKYYHGRNLKESDFWRQHV